MDLQVHVCIPVHAERGAETGTVHVETVETVGRYVVVALDREALVVSRSLDPDSPRSICRRSGNVAIRRAATTGVTCAVPYLDGPAITLEAVLSMLMPLE